MPLNKKLEDIHSIVEKDFLEGGFKLSNQHFRIGSHLHSSEYYYIKRLFDNSEYCELLCSLLTHKVKALNPNKSTTLIGFRKYTSLLLNKVVNELNKTNEGAFNYETIDNINESFYWQNINSVKLNENTIIILPITSTCSTFIRLKKFIENYVRTQGFNSKIFDSFVSLFQIFHSDIKSINKLPIHISDSSNDLSKKLNALYSSFNWSKIENKTIFFDFKRINEKDPPYKCEVLTPLYNDFHLPEECPICFPELSEIDGINETPLFPLQNDLESPNLIFGLPNFKEEEDNLSVKDFIRLYGNDNNKKKSLLYGRIDANGYRYSNYILGNAFYRNNKNEILNFFTSKLKSVLVQKEKSHIVFLTADYPHNSNLLEDLLLTNLFKNRKVSVLRYQFSNEYVDNFISLHKEIVNNTENEPLIIYFEEVLSAGKSFKILSNYIKHTRTDLNNPKANIHGIDLLLTLIDRTPIYTRLEIIKKMYSDRIGDKKLPQETLIAFTRLNIPIFSATHMGNPLEENMLKLNSLYEDCHLDFLKLRLANEINEKKPRLVEELLKNDSYLDYFPFYNIESSIEESKEHLEFLSKFNKYWLGLLKVYILHKLNSLLVEEKFNNQNAISDLIDQIISEEDLHLFFVENKKYGSEEIINGMVIDFIFKLLTKHPYTNYKELYFSAFSYCLKQLDKLFNDLLKKDVIDFITGRNMKYLIRRSVVLNSNFIISTKFIHTLENYYNNENLIHVKKWKESHVLKSNDEEKLKIQKSNLKYKERQTNSFFAFLLLCYKQLLQNSTHRTLRLEKILSDVTIKDSKNKTLEEIIKEPYYSFIGMLRSENIKLINDLIRLHEKILQSTIAHNLNTVKKISAYYFKHGNSKKDPIILQYRKFMKITDNYDKGQKPILNLRNATSKMLLVVNHLTKIKRDNSISFMNEIRNLLDLYVSIAEAKAGQSKLNYFFVFNYDDDDSKSETYFNFSSRDSHKNSFNKSSVPKNGLIGNLIKGIGTNKSKESVQTIIAGYKDNGSFKTFNDFYYDKEENKYDSRSLISIDQKKIEDFNKSNYFLAIRLSSSEEKNKEKILGRGALVILSNEPTTKENYFKFFKDERIRLMLVLRERITNYLQSNFSNPALIDVLENKKIIEFQSSLRHGLSFQLKGLNQYFKMAIDKQELENLELKYKLVLEAIKGQVNASALTSESSSLSLDEITKHILLIFKTSALGKYSVEEGDVKIIQKGEKSFNFNNIIKLVIIPELITNMKKYTPRSRPFFNIILDSENEDITFKNTMLSNPIKLGTEQGLILCNELLEKMEMDELDIKKDIYFEVKLKLKK